MKRISTGDERRKAEDAETTKAPTPKQVIIIKAKQLHPEMTTREIGKITDSDHAYVLRTLRRYGLDTKRDLELYKEHRANILAGVQGDLISTYYTLSDKDKRKLIMRRGLVDMGISYDKERLERDLSTVNVEAVIADLAAIVKAQQGAGKDEHGSAQSKNQAPGNEFRRGGGGGVRQETCLNTLSPINCGITKPISYGKAKTITGYISMFLNPDMEVKIVTPRLIKGATIIQEKLR